MARTRLIPPREGRGKRRGLNDEREKREEGGDEEIKRGVHWGSYDLVEESGAVFH